MLILFGYAIQVMVDKLRVLFFGASSRYGLLMLQAIAGSHQVIGVVEGMQTPPPEGARHALPLRVAHHLLSRYGSRPSLEYSAARLHIPYFIATRNNRQELHEFIADQHPDIACVAAFPFLLPTTMLALPRWGFLNAHPSLLPNYRGPNPWFWQYFLMERVGGVTIHRIDAGADTGDILRQHAFIIEPGWELSRFKTIAARTGAMLMVQVLQQFCTGAIHPIVQRHLPCAVHARKVRPDEPLFDWGGWPIERAWHILRGTLDELHALPAVDSALPGFAWKVLHFEQCPCFEMPGTVHHDRHGYYAAHREGKIRLRRTWSLRRCLAGYTEHKQCRIISDRAGIY